MANDTEVRLTDKDGRVFRIKRIELDGNGYIYIDGIH
jgi:hypothetical protein